MNKKTLLDLMDSEFKAAELYHQRDLYRVYGLGWGGGISKATMYLPQSVTDALLVLSTRCAEHNLKLAAIEIKRQPRKPDVHEYTVMTSTGNVAVKQEV